MTVGAVGGPLGAGFTCAVRNDGTLWCWGSNGSGVLFSSFTGSQSPDPVQIGTGNVWTAVSAGDGQVCALQSDGTLWCWGLNDTGQCGSSSGNPILTPTQVGTRTDWQAVRAGAGSTCALAADGTVWCFGDDLNGALGDGPTDSSGSTPVQVCL